MFLLHAVTPGFGAGFPGRHRARSTLFKDEGFRAAYEWDEIAPDTFLLLIFDLVGDRGRRKEL